MSSCVTKSAWSIWTAVKNSVRSEKKNNGAEIVLRQAYENSSTRALQQAMVVTVREESPTNNATRDYLTDLTYQCPKGTYKEWLENSLELISVEFWNQTDCLVHNNREYLFNNAFFIFVVNIVKFEIRKKSLAAPTTTMTSNTRLLNCCITRTSSIHSKLYVWWQ